MRSTAASFQGSPDTSTSGAAEMATPAPGRPMRRCCAVALILAATTPFAPSSLRAQERVDTAAIARIRAEAMDHSQVMDIMSWLTDVYGPRLTWGPNVRKAADWTMTTMKSWGLANVHLEDWYVPNAL